MKGTKVFIREPVAKALRDSAKTNKRSYNREAEQIISQVLTPPPPLMYPTGRPAPEQVTMLSRPYK